MENLFLLQFRHELIKMFARKRTYIGFGAFLAVEGLVLVLIHWRGQRAIRYMIEQNGFVFDQYFSGSTLGLMMVMWTVLILGGLYLALVSGDVMSKEVEEGTMRMMLCRPVSRLRICLIKYLSCVAYTFSLTLFISGSALIVGLLYRGMGGLFVFAPMERVLALYEPGPGLVRYLAAMPLLACCLTTIASLGFLLSCLNMKPAAATVVTLSVVLFDIVFRNIPYFEDLKPYFISTHMSTWVHIFVHRVPWREIVGDVAYLWALNATFLVVGIVAFSQRDFKA